MRAAAGERAVGLPEWRRIHEVLRRSILDVALTPGSMLSELEIAARHGTSRTPVREALLRLADEGLVEIRPQRGTYVARIDVAGMADALFVREAVESAVLRRVCVKSDRVELSRELRAIVALQAAAAAAGDVQGALSADERFHRRLFTAAGRSGVWHVVQQVRDLHHRVRAIAVPELGSAKNAIADHRAIIAAVQSGDAELAVARIGQHLARNLALARTLAARHPDYFADASAPASR